MYGSLDISVSGMIAQRTRMNVIAANIANADTVLDPNDNSEPFRRRIVTFAPGADAGRAGRASTPGVHVAEISLDQSPFRKLYDPSNPYAAKETDPDRDLVEGYVNLPNIDTTIEQINAVEAARAYDANVAVAEATKTMLAQALQLIA